MICVSEAKEIIEKSIQPLAPERCGLLQASGKTLAEDVWAAIDIPAFKQSSVDGYAVRFADKHSWLEIAGEMAAGTAQELWLKEGEAARIFTGAPLPHGADTVVMQENVQFDNGRLRIEDFTIKQGANVRNKGDEVAAGSLAISRGTLLTPAAIGFLAGIGVTEVPVYPAPTVTIIVTGKELQTPGEPLRSGQVYECNSFSLQAALSGAGVSEITVLQADDNLDELSDLLASALSQSDVVLLTGGVSVGDYDFVIEATKRCGVEQRFHKVAQRPGKPLYFGTMNRKVVFGLPGNPSSVLICFYNYVLPAIGILSNRKLDLHKAAAPLAKSLAKPLGLTQFLKGKFEDGKAWHLGAQQSFQLSSFAVANCLIELDAGRAEYEEGESVELLLLPQ